MRLARGRLCFRPGSRMSISAQGINLAMHSTEAASTVTSKLKTEILLVRPIDDSGNFKGAPTVTHSPKELKNGSTYEANLRRAADELLHTDIPVAFPTETVYGLGADATRSSAVQGIYRAKQRPSDNPLIVHVHSLQQVRSLLRPGKTKETNGSAHTASQNGQISLGHNSYSWKDDDPIPHIYRPLIEKFWPGPLTLIMPNPDNSILAPEVTSGLTTFGVRMPKNWLALALLKMANVPLAAPSANASTKPSPTSAEHVKYDLDGRISTILDGGPCEVGLESTVVDGLSDPPLILRPGGVSIEELRRCPGWESVTVGYKDTSQAGSQPKAPGMKYRHYSPKATVVLHESGAARPNVEDISQYLSLKRRIGIVRTASWPLAAGLPQTAAQETSSNHSPADTNGTNVRDDNSAGQDESQIRQILVQLQSDKPVSVLDIGLGASAENVARGLFSALRELDRCDVDAIFVEGIDDTQGDVATAVMNRLRKASEIKIEW